MTSQLSRVLKLRSSFFLNYYRSARLFSTPVEASKPAKAENNAKDNKPLGSKNHKVDNFERKMLVWTGKYKSTDEVPDYINVDVMEKARNRIRIRVANVMMALTAIGCIYMVFSGKSAAERGESVQKMNMDWHKEYNDKAREQAEKAQKKQ